MTSRTIRFVWEGETFAETADRCALRRMSCMSRARECAARGEEWQSSVREWVRTARMWHGHRQEALKGLRPWFARLASQAEG